MVFTGLAAPRTGKFGVVFLHPPCLVLGHDPGPDPGPNPNQDTPDTPDGSGLPFDAAVGRFECIVADGGRGDAGGDTDTG